MKEEFKPGWSHNTPGIVRTQETPKPLPHWIRYIQARVHPRLKKNFLAFITGPTGSGKSWASLSICEQVDPEFSIERVVFSGIELMELLNSNKLHRGNAICFEETGVELNNKQWASITNKMINHLIQTFRYKGNILIMNSPYMDDVDKSIRKLFHAEFQTENIHIARQTCTIKPQLMQYNNRVQKFYFKYLRVITRNGTISVNRWEVRKPSSELIKAYEEKKDIYNQKLNADILEELHAGKAQDKARKDRIFRRLTDRQKQIAKYLNEGLSMKEMHLRTGISLSALGQHVVNIEKKGYDVIRTRDENGHITKYQVIGADEKR